MNAKGSLRPNGVKTCNKPEQHAAIHPKMTVFSCADNLDMFFWPLIIVYWRRRCLIAVRRMRWRYAFEPQKYKAESCHLIRPAPPSTRAFSSRRRCRVQ